MRTQDELNDRRPIGAGRGRALVWLAATAACVGILAGCGSGGDSTAGETQTPPASTAAQTVAPDTGTSESPATAAEESTTQDTAEAPLVTLSGSCAGETKPGSATDTACAWIARHDPAVCERMSNRLLAELFGAAGAAGKTACKSAIGALAPLDDPSQVGYTAAERTGKRTTLTIVDSTEEITYALTFVRSARAWLLDGVQQLANAGAEALGEEPETVSEHSPGDDGEIAALVTQWYGQAAPSVCDSMTNKMLIFGWGKKGARGRTLCEQALADARPVENPVVRKPSIQGDKATVEVVYGPDDERNVDELTLVRRNGAWLIDSVRLAGFAE